MHRRPPTPAALAGWGVLAVLLAALAGAACLRAAGRPLAPLDEAYRTLGYAREWAHADPFRLQPGGPRSPGGANLLHAWLLVPVVAVAGTREGPLLAGLCAVHALLFALALRAAWRLAMRAGLPAPVAHLAALGSLLSFPVIWGFFSGSDAGLACLLLLWLWELCVRRAAVAALLTALLVGAGGSDGPAPAWALPPVALLAALVGILPLTGLPRALSAIGAALGLSAWFVGRILPGTGWFHAPSPIALLPVLTLLGIQGLARLAAFLPPALRRPGLRGAAAVWLVLSVAGIPRALRWMGRAAADQALPRRLLAESLAGDPGRGPVASENAGILAYFSGRRVLDLTGITDPALAVPAARGWGAIFDTLKAAPVADRPVLAVLRLAPTPSSLLRALPVSAPAGWGLFDLVWPAPDRIPAMTGWALADELDVADPVAERVHGYHVAGRDPADPPHDTLEIRKDSVSLQVTGDGGWRTGGGERFTMHAAPGRPAVLLMRTFAPAGATLAVRLGAGPAALAAIAPTTERFQTVLVAQAEGPAIAPPLVVEVDCRGPAPADYASFHYWLFQPSTRP